MITLDTLNQLLDQLGFTHTGQKHSKTIGDATLTVDWKKGEIFYPEAQGLTINERQTCNLSSDENFVVLECVHRLLEKGYKPANIELEPKWKLGHGASGGRADILVKDNAGKPLLIIECKTAGSEFNRAWKKTLNDGDQLFSYAQQISETQFLCLYASDLEEGALTYTSHIIAHRDNDKYLDDTGLKGFKTATDVKERFAIWRDTYKLDYTTKGIFEPSIQTYQIGKDQYSLDDLNTISASDQQKQYHAFATILRQHNVSGRENAFDKLVNLLLCKLVDETLNPQDLKFYWKGVAYDSHFDLFDRLQQLYKEGMGKFLGEPITYIDRSAVQNAMRFIKQNPDATQRAVWQLFLQQKFFTNNDFSFIDVHNEKLFYQNAEVLLKVIQMWQDIRLTNEAGDSQFLGDLFEGFLDQGVKQSEGQYFTPLPICRFIMMSLPLHSLITQHATPPKVIDYACGAGHFLTELARQIKPLVAAAHPQADIATYHQAIIGIEKEYRLSKVAKVAAFMHGQRDIAICYGDALIKIHPSHPQIADNSFDILVANPPYSVKGFLETLPEAERAAYALTDTATALDTNNSIECFFIERAKQLLKAGGIAAIILPASILSNGNSTYIKTREILIQYFNIVAIAEFGSGTFGKTGTNTVTLFLRRKATAPDTAEHYRERVAEWFAADANQPVYQDEHLIDRYAAHIGVPAADYKTLLQGDAHGPWCSADYFDAYTAAFNDSTEIKNLYKQKKFNSLPQAEQDAEIDRRYLAFVHAIERDKLLHFVLASDQKNPVLIIKSPNDTKAQKQFLGYDWSSAKGDEGIKLVKDAQGRHQTVLYDESDRHNTAKLNRCIADNFDGQLATIPAVLSGFASTARLVDMLDFGKPVFDKPINLVAKTTKPFNSAVPLIPLGKIATFEKGVTYSKPDQVLDETPNAILTADNITLDGRFEVTKTIYLRSDLGLAPSKQLKAGDVFICLSSGSKTHVGKVAFIPSNTSYFAGGFMGILRANDKILPKLLFELLNWRVIRDLIIAESSGANIQNLSGSIQHVEIPLPPLPIQHQIVTACQAVDNEVAAAQTAITTAIATVNRKISQIYESATVLQPIDSLALAVQYGLSEKMNEAGVGYKIFRMNEIIAGRMADNGSMKCADISADEFAKYRLNKGDVLFNRTNSIEHVGKTGLFDLDGDYCFASYLVRVVPDTAKVLPLFLTLMMNSAAFQQEAKGKASKSINQANINATIMRNIKVPVPPLAEQQRIVAEVEAEQRAIAAAESIIAAAPARKQAILESYL